MAFCTMLTGLLGACLYKNSDSVFFYLITRTKHMKRLPPIMHHKNDYYGG